MPGVTRRYATARPFCGHHAQPGVTQVPGALDWSHQETTPDQVCIEAVLETVLVPGASMLHVGVGNSKFAQRCTHSNAVPKSTSRWGEGKKFLDSVWCGAACLTDVTKGKPHLGVKESTWGTVQATNTAH